jgi:hypothetical protein
MPASGSGIRRRARHSLRGLFKGAKVAASARLTLKIKLARLSDEECGEVLDYIEIMKSSREMTEGQSISLEDSRTTSRDDIL